MKYDYDVIVVGGGHAGIENIGSYLSTDDENLSKCAIGCEHIEYSGRYGL